MNKTSWDSKTVETMACEDVFDSLDNTIEEAKRILNHANDLFLFLPDTSRQTREALEVLRKAFDWVKTVECHFRFYSVGDALKLTDAYDLMHRMAYNQPADKETINKIILKAFDALIHGDKDVDPYVLFKAIERHARHREQAFLDKPLTWIFQCMDEWHKQAVKGFDSTSLSDYDILSRVNILLDADLFAFEGRNQQKFKQRLAEQHHHYLDNYNATDRKTHSAVERFRYASGRLS